MAAASRPRASQGPVVSPAGRVGSPGRAPPPGPAAAEARGAPASSHPNPRAGRVGGKEQRSTGDSPCTWRGQARLCSWRGMAHRQGAPGRCSGGSSGQTGDRLVHVGDRRWSPRRLQRRAGGPSSAPGPVFPHKGAPAAGGRRASPRAAPPGEGKRGGIARRHSLGAGVVVSPGGGRAWRGVRQVRSRLHPGARHPGVFLREGVAPRVRRCAPGAASWLALRGVRGRQRRGGSRGGWRTRLGQGGGAHVHGEGVRHAGYIRFSAARSRPPHPAHCSGGRGIGA